jgi:hypothetical protein
VKGLKDFRYDKSHVGTELAAMESGLKELSVFYRYVREDVDEFGGQDFSALLKSGEVVKSVFYFEDGHGKLIYTCFYYHKSGWRFAAYKALTKASIHGWSYEQECVEAFLLQSSDQLVR